MGSTSIQSLPVLYGIHPFAFKSFTTTEIRDNFLINLFEDDKANFIYTHYDRMIIGIISPSAQGIILDNYDNLKSSFFLERREIGFINVGGPCVIQAANNEYQLEKLDCLYVGKGTQNIRFTSTDPNNKAVIFALSAPAHKEYPISLFKNTQALPAKMGSMDTANERTIYKYIHKEGIQSCQLVMGLTILNKGSVWNTMPPHLHDRRMEAYFYFDLPANQAVFHYMGQPEETRHLVVKNHQAIVSPPWSIHAGCGTSNYGFIWGMAGENMEFTDMDAVDINTMK